MSRRKAFTLRVEIQVHSVDSRELKLCKSGDVALRVETLSSSCVTERAYPMFPIHFHEKLLFEKVIPSVSNLSEMQDRLNRESLKLELIHFAKEPKIVARFRTKLSDVLFPNGSGRIKLNTDSAGKFTGGTGPIVEVSAKMTLEERPEDVEPFAGRRRVSDDPAKPKLTEGRGHRSDEWRRRMRGGNENGDSSHVRRPRPGRSISYDCSICSSYYRYFRPSLGPTWRPSSHVKNWINFENSEKPIPHRQLFYDSLDFFYRQLRDRRNNSNHC